MKAWIACATLLLVAACASRPGTGGVFHRSVGTASGTDAVERSVRVLNLFQFEVEREERTPQLITVQTRWRARPPFDDERALGIAQAENRVTVTGRLRMETESGSLYAVDLTMENRVLLSGSPTWQGEHATVMYRTYADSLVKSLQRELTIGVRRF